MKNHFDITTVSFYGIISSIGLMAIVGLCFAVSWLFTPVSSGQAETFLVAEQPPPAQPPPKAVEREIVPVVQAVVEVEPEPVPFRPSNLIQAAARGTVDDVKRFLVDGINTPIDDRRTALHIAAEVNKNVDVIQFFIDAGFNVDVRREGNRQTPLHLAVRYNRSIEVVKCLLKNGADPSAMDASRHTPTDYATTQSNSKELLEILRAAGGKLGREIR